MRIALLSSGSGGNSVWVEGAGVRVLLDAGLPLRETRARAEALGLDLAGASELLLTHEHADHCAGAGVLARKLGVLVRGTAGTLGALRDRPPAELLAPLAAGETLLLGGGTGAGARLASLRVTPVALPHDAAEPVAYVFEERTPLGVARAAVVTDLGCTPPAVAEALQGLDALVLEFNHDLRMLLEGPYPAALKARIRSRVGHLSNAQAAALLTQLAHPGLRCVALAHLSEHNNTPSLARRAAEAALARAGCDAALSVGEQSGPIEPLEVRPRPPLPARRPAGQQAQLALW